MWSIDTSREQFVDILQNGHGGSDTTRINAKKKNPIRIRRGDIRLIWPAKPYIGERPKILVIRDSEIDDFFAWANTYLTTWCPISAYFRVLAEGEKIGEGRVWPSESAKILESASLGLVLGEAISHSARDYHIERIPMSWCFATFSFVAAQGVKPGVELDKLARKWIECRDLTGQASLRLNIENLLLPWQVLLNLVGTRTGKGNRAKEARQPVLVKCLADVLTEGEISTGVWKELTRKFNVAWDIAELMTGTPETRVNVFESVVNEMVSRSDKGNQEMSFVVAYLASRISPGTFKQVGLLSELLDFFPSSILWLGAIAGLHRNEQLSSSRVGRRVWRVLGDREYFFSRPRSDIGLRELRVVAEGRVFGERHRTDVPGRLIVEIEPWVTTMVRWPVHDPMEVEQQRDDLFGDKSGELNDFVAKLDELNVGLKVVEDKLKLIRQIATNRM